LVIVRSSLTDIINHCISLSSQLDSIRFVASYSVLRVMNGTNESVTIYLNFLITCCNFAFRPSGTFNIELEDRWTGLFI